MSKMIVVTITDDDVKGIAADNNIPESEWVFALDRVRVAATPIEVELQALATRLVENVVLTGKVDWPREYWPVQ